MRHFWSRLLGTYADIRHPHPDAVPLLASEVRIALLTLHRTGVPFHVRDALPEENADLVMEYQVKEIATRFKTRMRLLPEVHEVHVLEERWAKWTLELSDSYGRGPAAFVHKTWGFERGPNGRRRLVETFRFSSTSLRDPLLNAVLSSGWTWRSTSSKW